MQRRTKFYADKLAKLCGGTVVGAVVSNDYGIEFYGLQIHKKGETLNLWLLQDDEGNGPGSFRIEEVADGEEDAV